MYGPYSIGSEKFPEIPILIPVIPGDSGHGNEKYQYSNYSRYFLFPGNVNDFFGDPGEQMSSKFH